MPVPRSEPSRRLPPGARRAAILTLLDERGGPQSVAELAPLVGLHPNTVRAHLDVLVRTGQVIRRTDPRNIPGRPREVYQSTGAVTADRNYRLLAAVLASRLDEVSDDPAAAAADAGRRWSERSVAAERGAPAAAAGPSAPGPTTEPGVTGPTAGPGTVPAGVGPVIALLQESGFAPRMSPDGGAIELHHCPFRELAEEHPDVVCGAHLGLIQGALATTGDLTATRILPFVAPDLCLAELSRPAGG